MTENYPTYRHGRESPYEELNGRQPCSNSLVEEFFDEFNPSLPMLAAHQGDRTFGHATRVIPSMLAYVTDPEFHTECLNGQHVVDHKADLCFSKPTDTVKGIAGSEMTNSAHSSLSSSFHDFRTDTLPFDQAIVQGVAAWAEENCNGESYRHRPLDLEPDNNVEAEIMAARALEAYAATSIVDKTLSEQHASEMVAPRTKSSRRRCSSPLYGYARHTHEKNGPKVEKMVSSAAAQTVAEILHDGSKRIGDIESQQRTMTLVDVDGKYTLIHRVIKEVLLVVLFLGVAIRFGYWVI